MFERDARVDSGLTPDRPDALAPPPTAPAGAPSSSPTVRPLSPARSPVPASSLPRHRTARPDAAVGDRR